MKAFIQTTGDRSVGIDPDEISLEWNIFLGSKEEREKYRSDLKEIFQDLCDNGKTYVVFEDECADCGALLPEIEPTPYSYEKVAKKYGPCVNSKCPRNYDTIIREEEEKEKRRLEKRAKQLRKTVAYKRYENWSNLILSKAPLFVLLECLHSELDRHSSYGSAKNAAVAYEALEQFMKDREGLPNER